ncbi:hypothetical protein FBU30_002899 [Linnemannia zychae]|nr:hypothetical protein FBU30_002899 [Linnemannia zychae]
MPTANSAPMSSMIEPESPQLSPADGSTPNGDTNDHTGYSTNDISNEDHSYNNNNDYHTDTTYDLQDTVDNQMPQGSAGLLAQQNTSPVQPYLSCHPNGHKHDQSHGQSSRIGINGHSSNDNQDDDWSDEDEFDESDKDEDENIDEEPDPIYIADKLRKSGINWMRYPKYATHRLVVGNVYSSNDSTLRQKLDYYQVIAQFLIPTSAVFRDFLNELDDDEKEDNCDGNGKEKVEYEEQDSENFQIESYYSIRLGCLRRGLPSNPTINLGSGATSLFSKSSSGPHIPKSILKPLLPFLSYHNASHAPTTSTSAKAENTATILSTTSDGVIDSYAYQPWIHLSLRHPEHFPGLLRAMYTMNLKHWETVCFRPDTIVGITEMTSRLECSSALTLCCLKYFRRFKDILAIENFVDERERAELEEVWRLYRAAVEAEMLPPDPDI